MTLRDRADSFDPIAELYDRVRPGYPEPWFDELLARTEVAPPGPVLEIGPGTGRASLPLATRGYRLVAVEPGARLAALWRARLRPEDGHRIEVSTFEAADLESEAFPLAISAQAFHWVDSVRRLPCAHAALAPGGWLAVFGNAMLMREDTLHRDIAEIYASRGEASDGATVGAGLWYGAGEPFLVGEIRESPLFGEASVLRHRFAADYSRPDYIDLLRSHSHFQVLDEGVREPLFADVGAVIDRHGGTIRVDYVCTGILARRAEASGDDAGLA